MEDCVARSNINIEGRPQDGSDEEAGDHSYKQYQGLPPGPRHVVGLEVGHGQ